MAETVTTIITTYTNAKAETSATQTVSTSLLTAEVIPSSDNTTELILNTIKTPVVQSDPENPMSAETHPLTAVLSTTSSSQLTAEQTISQREPNPNELTGMLDPRMAEKAKKIAAIWREHRRIRESNGMVVSAESRDKLQKRVCLHHLHDEACPAWAMWKDVLNSLKDQQAKAKADGNKNIGGQRELLTKLGAHIEKGTSVQNHLWLVLDTEHWLELFDRKHRYGSNLKVYHDEWLNSNTKENFFQWLDEGSGKTLDLKERQRYILESQNVKYLTDEEREHYEVIIQDGLFVYKHSGQLVHTNPSLRKQCDAASFTSSLNGSSRSPSPSSQIPPGAVDDCVTAHEESKPIDTTDFLYPSSPIGRSDNEEDEKWIYVTDCRNRLYIGKKTKGHFHHSSFLAGGAIRAAGGIQIRNGKLEELTPKSGHYKPAQQHFSALVNRIREQGINLEDVKVLWPSKKLEQRLVARYECRRVTSWKKIFEVPDHPPSIRDESQISNDSDLKKEDETRTNLKSSSREVNDGCQRNQRTHFKLLRRFVKLLTGGATPTQSGDQPASPRRSRFRNVRVFRFRDRNDGGGRKERSSTDPSPKKDHSWKLLQIAGRMFGSSSSLRQDRGDRPDDVTTMPTPRVVISS
ncbi:1117_t:CDS:2 [Paraglomus brasilianum]|uniref:1117_t:CDS:1 n=1 Tax=Paraglomus brasilianum TaxID=144538 RepID=A0A9N9GIL5_9GLOM|nr:1117_t:CDS:2 [Paraglomus brasilianum]